MPDQPATVTAGMNAAQLEAIRERAVEDIKVSAYSLGVPAVLAALVDRAVLLAEVERLRAGNERVVAYAANAWDKRDAAEACLAAVRELHTQYSHDDDGFHVLICRHCCMTHDGYDVIRTQACISSHTHGPGHPSCATRAAVDGGERGE